MTTTQTNPNGSPIQRFKALTLKHFITSGLLALLAAEAHQALLGYLPFADMPHEFILGFCFSLALGMEMGYDAQSTLPGFLANAALSTLLGAALFSASYLITGLPS